MKKLVLAVIVAVVVVGAIRAVNESNRGGKPVSQAVEPGPAPAPAPKWNPTTQEVAARDKLLDKLQGQNVFGDIKVANRVGKVVVGRALYPLDLKARQQFASVAMAWCMDHDPACDVLVLKDWQSGKEVGQFGEVFGGLKMDGGGR